MPWDARITACFQCTVHQPLVEAFLCFRFRSAHRSKLLTSGRDGYLAITGENPVLGIELPCVGPELPAS